MNFKSITYNFLVLFLVASYANAQVHCGSVQIVPNTSINEYMIFDDFTKYQGGITLTSVAKIRIRVEDKTVPDPLCSWSLRMFIDNNSGAGTPPTEWEELTQYGNGNGQNPPLQALEIRVRNACGTSPSDGIFRSFTNTGDVLDIIEQMLPLTPAGSCTQNVNGPGSYTQNYDEFNFDVDVRVKPNFNFNPGIFKLSVKFRLEENI